MKIIVTGGHLTPAYSFIEEAQTHGATIVVIGALGKRSVEAAEFAKLHVPYHSILPVKYDRYHKFLSILTLPKLIIPIFQSFRLLLSIQPAVIVVFGSFNALPVTIAAKLLNLPIYLHEQTRVAGLSNRIISHFATGCAVSYPETIPLLSCKNTLFTGNLLRHSIWSPPAKPEFTLPSKKPIIFVTGGNQGSSIILEAIGPLIPTLSHEHQLIIQHGNNRPLATQGTDTLSRKWFGASDISWLLSHSSIIISRGGANTISEIMVAGIPSIIIPLPQTSLDEQVKNAQIIASQNAGIIIFQDHLNSDTLRHAIHEIEINYQRYQISAKNLALIQKSDAAARLYSFISRGK